MKEIRNTKGKTIYRVIDGAIIPETPKNMRIIHETMRESKIEVNRSRSV